MTNRNCYPEKGAGEGPSLGEEENGNTEGIKIKKQGNVCVVNRLRKFGREKKFSRYSVTERIRTVPRRWKFALRVQAGARLLARTTADKERLTVGCFYQKSKPCGGICPAKSKRVKRETAQTLD